MRSPILHWFSIRSRKDYFLQVAPGICNHARQGRAGLLSRLGCHEFPLPYQYVLPAQVGGINKRKRYFAKQLCERNPPRGAQR